MKDVKTKKSGNTPRMLTNTARAPKEMMRRRWISAKKQAEETTTSHRAEESPVEYGENRIEETVDRVGKQVIHGTKRTVRKTNDLRKRLKRIKQKTNRGAEQTRSSVFSKDNPIGRGFSQQSQCAGRQSAQQGARSTKSAVRTTGRSVKGTMKTAQKSVKTAKATVKTTKHTVKATQKGIKTTAKATQKTAQAAAKAAQMAAKAAQMAAKAAATAAKAMIKVIMAIVKAIIAAVKALIAAIAAGGWIVVVIIIVVALVIALLSLFGVFGANEAEGRPMTEAIETIDAEFQDSMEKHIAELSQDADHIEIIYEGDAESAESLVANWTDVIAVYAAKTSLDPENPGDVTVVNEENVERLNAIFYNMNHVSYRTDTKTETVTVTDEAGAVVVDEDGEPVTETMTTQYIYVNVLGLDYREAAKEYGFNEDQKQMLEELMLPDYYPLFAELLGDTMGDGGEYGFGFDINPDLPPNELGAKIVQAAKKYIGRSYASMDCSKMVRTAYNDCGLTSMNGLTSTGMALKCKEMGVLFTDPSQLQAGDLIFFARKDAKRGPGYCTDRGRCGNGKCKRWQQIHHVAIYINDEFLIDSTGGKNSVQIRKHWGKNGSEWEWVCFGRPTT